jgi:hypothetical protein
LAKDIKKENKKPNVIFLVIFGLLILGSVAFTYYRIMVKRDYLISAEAGCDPTSEKCFVYVCDPKVDGDTCTGNPEEDTSYYKIIKRKAFNIPSCDPNDENCEALICPEGEKDCTFDLCQDNNADGIKCNDPEQYNIDHPADATDEADTTCAEGDEECISEQESSGDEAPCDSATEDCTQEASPEVQTDSVE